MDKARTAPRMGQLLAMGLLITAVPATAQLEEKLEALEEARPSLYDGEPVTLEECLRIAELGSATLGRFEEEVRNAEVDKQAALAQFLPNLTLSASWQRSERTDRDQPIFEEQLFPAIFYDILENPVVLEINGQPAFTFANLPTGETEDQTTLQTFENESLRSAWTVFNGFDRFAERNQADAALKASEATLGYQRQLLRENVTNAYYDLLRAMQRVAVALDAEGLARRELERSETYFELGISTRADVLQAKVRHQQTKLDVVRERNGERNAFATLAHAMNLPRAERFAVADISLGVEGMGVPDIEPLVERAREQRLDLEATRWTLDVRESGVTRARSGYYPAIEIFGSFSHSVSETPQSLRFGAQENTSLSWGIQGQWNIFDRFRTRQQSRRAVADRRRAEYDLRQAELDMELEIIQLHNNLVDSIEGYEVSTVTVEQASEELRLAEERFRVGAGTSLDVITAQVNLAQARRDLVDSRMNILMLRNQLARAVGGRLPE